MVVGETVVVETQQMQQRDMDITDMVHTFDGFGSDFVRGPDRVAGPGASAGKPHGHRFGVVITTVGFSSAPLAVVWGPTELAAENDQRFVK